MRYELIYIAIQQKGHRNSRSMSRSNRTGIFEQKVGISTPNASRHLIRVCSKTLTTTIL